MVGVRGACDLWPRADYRNRGGGDRSGNLLRILVSTCAAVDLGCRGLARLVAINALQVGRFGEFEYWFALIKVSAIVAFIAIGAMLILGVGPRPALGLSNLVANGGFLPFGLKGVWLALTLAVTSYMGVEVIAVTAGEARDPERSIPRAMRTIVYRLIFFYVLAISAMLAMTPWNRVGSKTGINGSPFVSAFAGVGIPYAASIMNLVVITAALSSCNADLYLDHPDAVLAFAAATRPRGSPG